MFNFIKKIALAALSFFLLRIFFSRTKSFIDIDYTNTQVIKSNPYILDQGTFDWGRSALLVITLKQLKIINKPSFLHFKS